MYMGCKMDNKLLLEFSKKLVVLYVEDEEELRENTGRVFLNFFKHVDVAENGVDALEKYKKYEEENSQTYDLIITDINMPKMDGIELSKNILKHNIDQYIVIISAHNESNFYHEAINAGVSGFLNKPINLDQLKLTLYKASQIVSDHKTVHEHYQKIEQLNIELDAKNKELEEIIKKLKAQSNAIDAKSNQVEHLLINCTEEPTKNEKIDEYFEKDEDEGEESVLFMDDDGAELGDTFVDITESIDKYFADSNFNILENLTVNISKVSSILLHYTPFLDPLAKSFDDLSAAISDNPNEFMEVIQSAPESMVTLFDAIAIDMERYVERFSVESMAMKNIHHIHEPTSLSIKQVIVLFVHDEEDAGDIEFF